MLFLFSRLTSEWKRPTDLFTQGAFLTHFSSVQNKRFSHSLRTLCIKSLHKTCLQKKDIFVNLVDTFYAKIWCVTRVKNVKNACSSYQKNMSKTHLEKKVGRVIIKQEGEQQKQAPNKPHVNNNNIFERLSIFYLTTFFSFSGQVVDNLSQPGYR